MANYNFLLIGDGIQMTQQTREDIEALQNMAFQDQLVSWKPF